ncbi:MAG: hypothetical protein FWF44_00425 [Defluviitaleaceae bacterium]|nr:hypothetical protein [Defluviitaleaceae bacterium]
MDFSPEINQKLERYKAFYGRPEAGQLLITIPPYTYSPADRPLADVPLSAWRPFEDAERMAEYHVGQERWFAEHTRDVLSDYIPSVGPGYGIGMNSAFLSNAPLIPAEDTSWIHPVLDELSDMKKLRFDPDNPWVDFMRRYMKRAVELCEGDYCVNMLAAFAPSDLANALRGNQLFYDLYDEPEQVDELLSQCADAIIALYRELVPYTLAPDGGFNGGGMWIPGSGLFLSEDGADLCSPEQYDRFFFPQTQRVIDAAGGAYIHHHAQGWKVHGRIAGLKNLRFLEFSWDPNRPRPVDHLDELLELSLKVPLQIRCTLKDLKERAGQMRQGRVSVMVNVDTLEEAKEAVRVVRRNSVI